MTDRRLVVLRAMGAVTQSTDMDEFMRQAGLTMSEVLETLKALAQDGFVVKTKHGFAIAEKGKQAIAAFASVADDEAFRFYMGFGQPAGVSMRSIKEFYDVAQTVPLESLAFHLERDDFENWMKTSVENEHVAGDLARLKQEGLKGEVLRKQLLLTLSARFGEDVLLREWTE